MQSISYDIKFRKVSAKKLLHLGKNFGLLKTRQKFTELLYFEMVRSSSLFKLFAASL